MEKPLAAELISNSIEDMSSKIEDISDLYTHIPGIIKKEHDCIMDSDLDGVEESVAEKLKVSSLLDESFLQLREATLSLVHNYESVMEKPVDQVANLSQCFTMIDELVAKLSEQGSEVIKIKSSAEHLKTAFETFLKHKDEYQGQIEVNRIVLSKMLASRQDHYRFWQEVSSDMMAAYNRKGVQRSSTKRSSLSIKA